MRNSFALGGYTFHLIEISAMSNFEMFSTSPSPSDHFPVFVNFILKVWAEWAEWAGLTVKRCEACRVAVKIRMAMRSNANARG